MNNIIKSLAGVGVALSLFAGAAFAATPVVVTPANTQGWSTADTRPNGTVNFVADPNAPGGNGALELKTDATTTAKAQYLHEANTPLSSVTELSYYTKQVSASFAEGDPSYQLVSFLNGGTSGFTTLVFEPYQNPSQGPVINNTWQQWDVDAGLFWSTRTVTCSGGIVAGTPGGPASYTLAQINALCPEALVAGFGVNIGSNSPLYTVRTDLFNFNGTTYDFELFKTPRSKDECKNDGYKELADNNGQPFKNQGQCVSYFNHN